MSESVHCDRNKMILYKNINSLKMKTVGAVMFIHLLLLIAGVEPNPGPSDVLVFRYQYLLIEVGTHLLRKLFNDKVSNDFMQYLKTNNKAYQQLQYLLGSDVITDHQKQFLPPLDNSPNTENFDITLLVCFLRNICGLKQYKDPVWKCPASRDRTVEAEITRLKECRNFVAHTGTVYLSKSDFKQKWFELCQILHRLNQFCVVPNLPKMIVDASSKPLDDQSKHQYDNILKAWQEAETLLEKGIDQIKIGQSKIRLSLKNVEKKQDFQAKQLKRILENSDQPYNTTKRVKSSTNDDIQKILIDAYQNEICSSLPLCPLLEDEKGGLLELYEVPTMYVVNYHKVEKQQTDKSPNNLEKVKTCSDLFHVKDKYCKNIYLTGDAGVGKTSFCKFLSLLWCKSKLGKKLEKVDMQEYIDYLARFDFVFYVNLRDTHFTDLIAIVVNQLFYCQNDYEMNRMYIIVKEILGIHDSLVIMDGLDEWTPKPSDKRTHEIPFRPKSLKCVYLTTCRPYRIENVRLTETDLDHQVQMTGLGKLEIESYVEKLIIKIDHKFDDDKIAKDFFTTVEQVNMSDQLNIPMVTSHLVMLWFNRPLISMSKFLIYGNIMDMLFELADKKEIDIPISSSSGIKLPHQLTELEHFKSHFPQVEKLCLLSYNVLFEQTTDITCLVFTRKQLAEEPYSLSEAETNLFCKIGILSKKKIVRKFGPKECKLSFLHKSYLEFFAAIYVSSLDTSNVLGLFSQCRTIIDVLRYTNFLIFYAGLSKDNLVLLITRIYSLISKDLDATRALSIFSIDNVTGRNQVLLLLLQDLILKCYIEGSYQIESSLQLEDVIFDSDITDTDTKYLRKLILSNSNNVRLLRSEPGEYLDEFNSIVNLQVLYIENCDKECCIEFKELMKQNKSSLQIISITGQFKTTPILPLNDLHYLTSLSLEDIGISHEDIQYLTKFLSNNSQLKHVRLKRVKCTEHGWHNDECESLYYDVCGSFELVRCNKLVYLYIDDTNIVCTNIDTSSLEYIELCPDSENIARSYINIFNSIQNVLELKHLNIKGDAMLDDYLVETLITNVQYLSKIESIELGDITLRDNVSFLLHPSVKQVSIELVGVNMTARWFHIFIESVIDKHCCIKFHFFQCIIRQEVGDTKGDMSEKESCDYIHDYIKSKSAIKIVRYDNATFHDIEFEINDNQ